MDNIAIKATERSPQISFDFNLNKFRIVGESYPENIREFYGDLVGRLETHLLSLDKTEIQFDFELVYFNSSSAKIFMHILDLLNGLGEKGHRVIINWYFDADDDNMEALGQDFGEDLEYTEFNIIKKTNHG